METTIQKYLQIKLNWSDKIRLTNKTPIPPVVNCLYAAYGTSDIYGQDSLLYIGQTRSLSQRMSQHLEKGGTLSTITNLHISVGVFHGPYNDISKIMDVTEKLLINILKPSHNSANINEASKLAKQDMLVHVLNYGNRYKIPLEVSNVHFYR